jgi:hypothetical protein
MIDLELKDPRIVRETAEALALAFGDTLVAAEARTRASGAALSAHGRGRSRGSRARARPPGSSTAQLAPGGVTVDARSRRKRFMPRRSPPSPRKLEELASCV